MMSDCQMPAPEIGPYQFIKLGAAASDVVGRLSPIVSARERVEHLCESPIEVLLASYFLTMFDDVTLCLPSDETQQPTDANLLMPQYPCGRYRADFVLRVPGRPLLVIECDGHDFHAATQDQIDYDRARDAEMAAAGFRVVRFTGSEISRFPDACVRTVVNVCGAPP